MDFKKKFEGKIIKMNKDGIIGLIKRKENPANIDKGPKNFQVQSRSLSPHHNENGAIQYGKTKTITQKIPSIRTEPEISYHNQLINLPLPSKSHKSESAHGSFFIREKGIPNLPKINQLRVHPYKQFEDTDIQNGNNSSEFSVVSDENTEKRLKITHLLPNSINNSSKVLSPKKPILERITEAENELTNIKFKNPTTETNNQKLPSPRKKVTEFKSKLTNNGRKILTGPMLSPRELSPQQEKNIQQISVLKEQIKTMIFKYNSLSSFAKK